MNKDQITEEQILSAVSKAVIDDATTISVDIKPKSWFHAILMRLGMKPKEIKYVLTGATYNTLMRAVPLLLKIQHDEMPEAGEGRLDWAYKTAMDNGELMKKVICIVIHNKRGEYPKELEAFVEDNFESKDFFKIAHAAVTKLDVMSFSNTIRSVRGLNPLIKMGTLSQPTMSPQEPVETIARGEQLVMPSNIFASATIV